MIVLWLCTLCATASPLHSGVADTVEVMPLRVMPLDGDSVPVHRVDSLLPMQMDSLPPVDTSRIPHSRCRRERDVLAPADSAVTAYADSAVTAYADSVQRAIEDSVDLSRFNQWKPDPIRAMWLAMVCPGGGQIYNRKLWKLPFVYGGVVGCIYAVSWNGQMLRDYSQAYQDIMDSDPTTSSYLEMLPMGYDISGREEHFKRIFKRKKDFYRRFRDLSIFCIAGVYLLSIIDAYVDAELSTFDIGTDLSMRLAPATIPTGVGSSYDPLGCSPGIALRLTY